MRVGDVVWNPLTGERAELLDMTGERLVADFSVAAGGFVPGGEHVHDHCAEYLEVQSGRINFALDGHERSVGPGEAVTVEPGTWHRWWNAGGEEVRIRVRVEPALRFAEAILVIWGLCADGRTDAKGRPSPLIGALVAQRYRPEIRYRQPPDVVQRLLFPPLAAVARRRGHEGLIDRYLDIANHPSARAAATV